ncbi:MAG: serine/threonine protein kinase [Fimbriiglobus sp.]
MMATAFFGGSHMLVGAKLGPFEVEKELGAGAMGTVYKARFDRDGTVMPVAIKIVSLGLLGNEGAMARFEREANILKQLRHPNIVRLIATGRYQKTPFIAMEFVDGQPLDRILSLRGKLGWEDVVAWGKQLCEALQHAHEKGIIHRDLKPSNLMITHDNILKLADFGIAKDQDVTALTGANSTIGTAAYMSPEQCRGERDLSAKSDLYSLGVVFYELLTGKKPFDAESTVDMFLKHVNETPVRPRRLVPSLPIWLDNLVMFLMEKDRTRRPLDAATVGKMLADIEEKVTTQQSVGAEVANARRIDRPVGDGTMDEADKDAARTLRGKKKKKPKPAPSKLPAVLSILGIVALVGGIGFVVFFATRRPGLDAQYAAVKAADGPDQVAAATAFLQAHGTTADPRVDELRKVFQAAKTKEAESVLLRRYSIKGLRGNAEDFDETAYKSAMLATDAEAAGDLTRAADLWAAVRAAAPPEDLAKLTEAAEVKRAQLGWVAEKRIGDIKDAVPAQLARLKTQIEQERLHEVAKDYPPGSLDAVAVRAVRFEQFPDKAKARAAWDRLAQETEKEPEARVWFLLAASQAAAVAAGKSDDDPVAAREKRVAEAVEAMEKKAKAVADDPEARVPRRDVRTAGREVIFLYDDDPNPAIRAFVGRAKKAVDSVPKK